MQQMQWTAAWLREGRDLYMKTSRGGQLDRDVEGVLPPSPEAMQIYRRSWVRRTEERLVTSEEQRHRARRAVRSTLPELLAQYPAVRRAYLFGSVLREGAFTASSDLDIALDGVDAAVCLEVWREAEKAMAEWALDVRPLDGSDFSARVRERGEIIYGRSSQSAQV